MREGDELRLVGPAGAPFVVTVGPAFTADYIEERLRTGEWKHRNDDAPQDTPPPADPGGGEPPADPGAAGGEQDGTKQSDGRPPLNAPKAEWIAYTVAQGQLSAEDAANYTKADLIDMAN